MKRKLIIGLVVAVAMAGCEAVPADWNANTERVGRSIHDSSYGFGDADTPIEFEHGDLLVHGSITEGCGTIYIDGSPYPDCENQGVYEVTGGPSIGCISIGPEDAVADPGWELTGVGFVNLPAEFTETRDAPDAVTLCGPVPEPFEWPEALSVPDLTIVTTWQAL